MNHLETLKAYQAWRLDDTEEPRTLSEMGLSAMAIGEALDWAIAELDGRTGETEARKLAQQQLEAEREEKRVWGLQLSAALHGDKREDETENDGRLDAVRAMKRENDELRAHVERLREAVGMAINNAANDHPEVWGNINKIVNETPAQSLAEIKAEAARKAIMDTLYRFFGDGDMLVSDMEVVADEYASAIREAE